MKKLHGEIQMKDKLIEKLNNGDICAFEKLMREYSGYVFAVVRNHSKDILTYEDMEELTADTFAALWQSRESISPDKPLMPFLAVTARNKTLNRLRSVRLTVPLEEAAGVPALHDLSDREQEAVTEILDAVSELPDTSREVFFRYYLYGEPLDRISKELGLSPSNIRTRLCRSRDKIKKQLLERGYINE